MIKFLFLVCLIFSFAAYADDVQLTDCDKFPDSVGCVPIEVPAGQSIPTETRDITNQSGAVFSGGSCPSDVTLGFRGHTLIMLPMSSACSWIVSWVRPLFLLIAGLTALFIVFPSDD